MGFVVLLYSLPVHQTNARKGLVMTDPKPDETPVVLECGCTLTFDTDKDSGTLAWLVPCSRVHRLVAQLSRKPGSMVVVCEVPS